jgi:hypothetical protein
MYQGVKRAYTVNEPVGSMTVGWYVNDVRKSTGTQYNFTGDAGDRIYAILNPPAGTANGNTLSGVVRSNVLIFNPDGVDGAGSIPNPQPDPTPDPQPPPEDNSGDIDGDGIPDEEDNDIDGDGIVNEEDDDIDGDGIVNDEDDTPSGDAVAQVATYDTLYTRASQAQYLGDVFHADPTHTNPEPVKSDGSIPTPLLIMVGLAGAFLIYNNRK